MTMSAYFAKMKRLADTLAIASKHVEHVDLITYILTGLESQECKSLVTSLLARGENMSLDDLYALSLNLEMRIEQKRGKISFDVLHNLSTNFAKKNQGLSKIGLGTQRGDEP